MRKNSFMAFPDWQASKWRDCAANPLLGPADVGQDRERGVIGDPQVLLPGEFDENWHLFCIGRGHFYRLDSSDGVRWRLRCDYFWNCGPACVTSDGRRWIVCYSRHEWPRSADSVICARTSEDLENWSEPVELVKPELAWEREGAVVQVRNPNLMLLPSGRFRLYYCGGTVWMPDMNFEEPKYIGFAEAEDALGPYEKHGAPVLGPEPAKWYRNHAAGAMKVFRYAGIFLGFANGIYIDAENHSRSAIDLLMSPDGIAWEDAPYNPILLPGGGVGSWNSALIYQLDVRWRDNKLLLYYNAREGWAGAREFIGLSTLDWPGPAPEKPWRLPARPGRKEGAVS